MALSNKNLLKSPDVFKCRHPAHKQFGYSVSPYHVIVEKRCYPDGCVEFLWRCNKFENGRKCPKNYKHVGRGCSSCKDFRDDKIHYEPTAAKNENELKRFIDQLNEFRGWLENMSDKRVRFSGVVESVKAHLAMIVENNKKTVMMDGFYASFLSGYFNNEKFDDKVYLRLSGKLLSKLKLAPGDEIESDVVFTEERGRIILRNPRNVEIERNGGTPIISQSRAHVGRATGKIINGAIVNCKSCEYCSLIDIEDRSRRKTIRYRRFYCLRGITETDNCPVRLGEMLESETKASVKKARF